MTKFLVGLAAMAALRLLQAAWQNARSTCLLAGLANAMSWLAPCMGMDAMAGAASQQEAGRTTAWAIAACVQGKNTNAQTNAQMRGNVRKDCMDLDRSKGAKTRWEYLSDAFRLVNRG
ncbi:MAG: hypothetical protein ACYCSR_07420 [Thiomonas sp.]